MSLIEEMSGQIYFFLFLNISVTQKRCIGEYQYFSSAFSSLFLSEWVVLDRFCVEHVLNYLFLSVVETSVSFIRCQTSEGRQPFSLQTQEHRKLFRVRLKKVAFTIVLFTDKKIVNISKKHDDDDISIDMILNFICRSE